MELPREVVCVHCGDHVAFWDRRAHVLEHRLEGRPLRSMTGAELDALRVTVYGLTEDVIRSQYEVVERTAYLRSSCC